jgi:MYXO-CTERM domain-containing protein
MFKIHVSCAAAMVLGCLTAHPARAHFILLKPDSWLNEDGLGGPQKGAPCGPGSTDPLFGDNVTPIPTSGKVTTFHAGETITVQWQTTIPHPGYFRIALAENRADFQEPPLADPVQCSFDLASVPKGPHDNVLMDGIDASASMQDVKLPDKPCAKCTLQVIDVMQDHGGGSCFYHHCADLQILPAGTTGTAGAGTAGTGASGSGAAAGTSGSAGARAGGAGSGSAGRGAGGGGVGSGGVSGGVTRPAAGGASGAVTGTAGVTGGTGTGLGTAPTTGAAGTTAPVAPAPTAKTSGCAVAQPGASSSGIAGWVALGLGALFLSRRKHGA